LGVRPNFGEVQTPDLPSGRGVWTDTDFKANVIKYDNVLYWLGIASIDRERDVQKCAGKIITAVTPRESTNYNALGGGAEPEANINST